MKILLVAPVSLVSVVSVFRLLQCCSCSSVPLGVFVEMRSIFNKMTVRPAHTYSYTITRMVVIFSLILILFSFIAFKTNNEIPIPIIALPLSIFLIIILSIKHTEIVEIKEEKIHITYFQFFIKKTVSFSLKECKLTPYQYKRGIIPAVHQLLIQKNEETLFTINGLKQVDIDEMVKTISNNS